MIRKLLSLCILALAVTSTAQAQDRGSFSAILGYQWGGGLQTTDGKFEIEPSLNYGAEIDIVVRPGAEVVLLYNRQDSEIKLTNRAGLPDTTFGNAAINYFHLGGMATRQVSRVTKPFFSATIGLTWFDPKQTGVSSEWRLSGSLSGGLKVMPSTRVGLRGQVRWWFTFLSSGSGWWCSLPGGCAVTATGTLISQGEASGGLVIAF